MKRCPQCQTFQEVASKFCNQCGHAFSATTQAGPGPVSPQPVPQPRPVVNQVAAPAVGGPAQYSNKGNKVLWGVAILATILAIGFGANGLLKSLGKESTGISRTGAKVDTGLTRATGQTDSGLMKQEAEVDAGLTRQTAEPAAGITKLETPPPEEAKQMPADIRAYLEHVRETERRRFQLSTKNLGDLKVKMAQLGAAGGMNALKKWLDGGGEEEDVKAPADELAADAAVMRREWDELSTFFQSVPPPRRCQTLRDRYGVALSETGAGITEVMMLLGSASADPQAAVASLERMKGTSKNIDGASKDANVEVTTICRDFNVRPWFEIQTDYGGGGLFSGLGF
jgi:hypothetical protein